MATVNASYTYTSSLKQQSIDANQQAQEAKAKAAQQSSQTNNTATSSTTTSTTASTSASSQASQTQASQTQASKEQRTVTVQQSLSQGKTAVEAASKANASIGEQLKKVKDVATQLADDTLDSKKREELQAQYSKLRDGIIAAQDKATVKNGDSKVNLLTDKKGQTVSTNSRGGEQDVASSASAKALGLPEKIGSAADAKALLSGDEKKVGSLANAQKSTLDTATRLAKDNASLSNRLDIAKAQGSAGETVTSKTDSSKTKASDTKLTEDQQKLRDQAIAQAQKAGEQMRSQLAGISGNNKNAAAGLLGMLS